jgi:hypothetical protein
MKNLAVKIGALLLVLALAEAGCTKQQYRARSKRYPHDVPKKG